MAVPGPYSGVSTLAFVARASAVTFGVVYGSIKLSILKDGDGGGGVRHGNPTREVGGSRQGEGRVAVKTEGIVGIGSVLDPFQESKPSVQDEPSSASKSAPLKGAASADSKSGLVPSSVPVTEEEIKSVLLATAPVALPDLNANFKGRIKSQEESKPSAQDEPSSASKSAPLKGAASADSKSGLVPSAVPVTEEEIKSVLLATAPVALPDLIAKFKGRIKSQEDKKAFADIIMRISKIGKAPDGNRYVALKDK